MIIRMATAEDMPALIAHGKEMHRESNYNVTEFSAERAEMFIRKWIEYGFVVVVEIDGLIIGGMIGDVITPWHTTERMGIDMVLYVAPEHRKGRIAATLIKAFEIWCKEMGATTIRPAVSTGHQRAGKLYQALGYQRTGECFIKKL